MDEETKQYRQEQIDQNFKEFCNVFSEVHGKDVWGFEDEEDKEECLSLLAVFFEAGWEAGKQWCVEASRRHPRLRYGFRA